MRAVLSLVLVACGQPASPPETSAPETPAPEGEPSLVPVLPGSGPAPWADADLDCAADAFAGVPYTGWEPAYECMQIAIHSKEPRVRFAEMFVRDSLDWGTRDGRTCPQDALARAGQNIRREVCFDLRLAKSKRIEIVLTEDRTQDRGLVDCLRQRLRDAARVPDDDGSEGDVRWCGRYMSRYSDAAIRALRDKTLQWDTRRAKPAPTNTEGDYEVRIGLPTYASVVVTSTADDTKYRDVEPPARATGAAARAIRELSRRASWCAAVFDEATQRDHTLGLTARVYVVDDRVLDVDLDAPGALRFIARCIDESALSNAGLLPVGAVFLHVPMQIARR